MMLEVNERLVQRAGLGTTCCSCHLVGSGKSGTGIPPAKTLAPWWGGVVQGVLLVKLPQVGVEGPAAQTFQISISPFLL